MGQRAPPGISATSDGKSRAVLVEPHQAGPHAASPPVMQSLNGGAPVWWRRAFSGNGQPSKGFAQSPAANHRRSQGDESPAIATKKGVRFNDMVEVRYVPLHSDYSQRVRQKYWNSAQELWDMAARNSLEFASEGYDYKQAVEEEVSLRQMALLCEFRHFP